MKFASADIQFSLDGQPRTLRFSAKALAALQDHWQIEDLDAVARKLGEIEGGKLGIHDAAAMLWAGLRTHHPDVTLDEALDLLDGMGLANFETLLSSAITAASSGGGDSAPANPPKPARRGR